MSRRTIRRAPSQWKTVDEIMFENVPIVSDLTLSETIDSLFVGAVRHAAKWPRPHRDLAREALFGMPADCFEPWIAERVN